MGKFILGVVVTLIVIAGGCVYAMLGHMPIKADVSPGKIETYFATKAFDASVERQAPKVKNPVQPTEVNLAQGMTIYTMNCALCHGSPAKKENPLGKSFYPPAPQFTHEPPDLPDYQSYWIIKNGVRYTAMAAWEKTLSDDEIWKVTTFLANWDKLPPAVKSKFGGQE